MVTLLTCVAFSAHAAWWDTWKSAGDDGNINTKGNPQVVNKAYVGLVNDTKSILTSAVLKDKTGKVLYTSTAGRTCAAGAVCWLRVSPGLMTKGNTFFFYNNGKLVSALVLDNLPANASLYNIGASMDSLGLYVMNKIRAVNPKVTYNRVDNDIQTTTLSATPYQELADYYLDLMGSFKDNTAQEAKVIKSMADQFAKNQAIPANAATTRLAKSTPVMAKKGTSANKKGLMVAAAAPASGSPSDANSVQNALCSETLSSAMDGLALIPMIGDVVATAAKTAKSASCPSGDQEVKDFMAEQFAVVNTKLGEISTQLTGLENQLKAFEQTYNMDKLTDQKADVYLLDSTFTAWLENYQRALLTSRGKDGKEYNSLNEMVSSFGSLDKAFAKNPELKASLKQLYDDKNQYDVIVKLADSAIPNFSTVKKDAICSNPDKIAGNVLEIRAACNAIIVAMYSKNIILAKQMAYAYNDVYKVYQMDTRPSDVKNLQIMDTKKFTAWETNVEQMNPTKAITKPVGASEPVFNLVNNLRAKGFNVTGWYTDADKRYLEVNYTLGGTIIKSKYAYQHPTRDGDRISYAANAEIDSNIANVMGVPVPERFFTTPGDNYGNNLSFPWSEHDDGLNNDHDALSSSDSYSGSSPYSFSAENSTNLSLNAFGFTPDTKYNKNSMISPNNGFVEGDRKIFAKDGANKYVLTYAKDDFNKIGSGDFFTFMRFTDTNGFSHLFAVRTWLGTGNIHWVRAATQCMTNDCISKSHVGTLGELKFQNGPASVYWGIWTNNQLDLTIK